MTNQKQVQLVQMGPLIRGLDLRALVLAGNDVQSGFLFILGEKMDSLGDPRADGTYAFGSLAARLLSSRASPDIDVLVGVVDVEIFDELFSAVDENSKCIIVSINDMEDILRRTNASYTGYILVEIAAQLLTIALRRTMKHAVKPEDCGPPWHQETKACLFDYSEKRDQTGKKLMEMSVCDACEAAFSAANIPASVRDACKAMVKKAVRRSFWSSLSDILSHPAVSTILSVLLGMFLTQVLAPYVSFWYLLVGTLCLLLCAAVYVHRTANAAVRL